MRKPVSPKRCQNNGTVCWRVCVPAAMQSSEKAKRRFFPDTVDGKAAARAFAQRMNATAQSWSAQLAALPDADQGRIICALQAIRWNVSDLVAACEAWSRTTIKSGVLLKDAVTDFLSAKKSEGVSDKHLGQMTKLLLKMIAGKESLPVTSYTDGDWDQFMNNPHWTSITSKNTTWGQVATFWGWAESKKLIKSKKDILTGKRPKAETPTRKVFTVDQISALLKTAVSMDKDMVSYFAITIFAGVRPTDEVLGLRASMRVDDHFVLPAELSKTRTKRNIVISPTLDAWLQAYPMPENGWPSMDRRRPVISAAAGVPWIKDGTRHSFCSYELPVMGEAKVTANAGNSVAILHKHYAGWVSVREVERYHSELTPEIVLGQNIVPMSKTA